MEYAVQTRDYNRDYRWSWAESAPNSLRAKASKFLLNQIQDGESGVAVVFLENSYHVIITAINALGDKPIGKDFSSANIRLNLVFSQISLEKAKGIVQYYINNQDNPGIAFTDIVTWSNNRDNWTVNEDRIIAAFESIEAIPATGRILSCEKGATLQSLLDFDWGQTEGVQYVYEPKSSNPVRITVAPIPEKPVPPPPQPKIYYWKRSLFLFLLLIAACTGLYYQWTELKLNRDKLNQCPSSERVADLEQEIVKLQEKKDELETNLNNAEEGLVSLNNLKTKWNELGNSSDLTPEELQVLNEKRNRLQGELDKAKRELATANNDNQKLRKNVQELNNKLTNLDNKLKDSQNLFETKLQKAKENYHNNFKKQVAEDLENFKKDIQNTVGVNDKTVNQQKHELEQKIEEIKTNINQSELEEPRQIPSPHAP